MFYVRKKKKLFSCLYKHYRTVSLQCYTSLSKPVYVLVILLLNTVNDGLRYQIVLASFLVCLKLNTVNDQVN